MRPGYGHNAKPERNAKLIAMRRAGKSIISIGRAFKISSQRVSQLLQNAGVNEQIKFIGCKELSERCGVPGYVAARALATFRNGRELVPQKEIDKVVNLIETTRRRCQVCGVNLGRHQKLRCGKEECERKGKRLSYESLLKTETGRVGRFSHGCLPIVAKAIKGVKVGVDWIRAREALARTGLSKTQLGWLARRGIVAVKNSERIHPVTKRPTRLYSAAQMAAIRKAVYPPSQPPAESGAA